MALTSLTVDPAERWIIGGGADGTVAKARLYQSEKSGFLSSMPSDHQMDWIITFPKSHLGAVRSVAVNSSGNVVASADDAGKLCLADVTSLQVLRVIDVAGKISQVLIVPRPLGFMEAVDAVIKPVAFKRVME